MSSKKYNFDGKVALVTGSSSGIGEAIAIQLAQYGAKLAIHGRNATALSKVAGKIEKICGEQPLQVIGDFTKDTGLPKKLIEETVNKFGRLDVLINNAGGMTSPLVKLTSPDVMSVYEHQFELNVRTPLDLTRLAVPHLEKTKGNIVNISSRLSLAPDFFIYSMSKAALDMLTKTSAQELGPKGIRVNSVNPGKVVTNFLQNAGVSDENVKKFYEDAKKESLLGMVAQPVDIANLVSFVASSDAANITGAILLTDTGAMVKRSG